MSLPFPLPSPPWAAARAAARASFIALLAAACAAPPPMLNSERIERRFGNYGIEILAAGDHERIANLYSVKDGRRTTRTHARTRFAIPLDDAVAGEHALITAGASIGATFKARGWRVERRCHRIAGRRLGQEDAELAALMRIRPPLTLAVHEYRLVVSRDGRSVEYATITEIHHPDHLTTADLARIYRSRPKTAK